MEEEIFGSKKVYTGEKIQLDFYEIDIKNVFRILRNVSKLNFAIDKNVDGKVTPQIMIEAKVVEVTKNFSQELGIGLNVSNASSVTSGFVKEFDVSVNHPVVSPSHSVDFSFFRLFISFNQ
jgi:type II secretory pathway component HofQ